MVQPRSSSEPCAEERKIKSVKRLKAIMTEYYIRAKSAGQSGEKIAWITSGAPVEPLIAMDMIPVYPENHGAMIGAAKMGAQLCEAAENMGYAGDLCSYALADIACAPQNGGPIGGLPKPDVLICCNNICGTVLKWYEIQARYFGVPLFVLDTPCCHVDCSSAAKRYVRRQLDEYFQLLEHIGHKRFSKDRLQEVGWQSVAAQRLWRDILATAEHKPAPMSAFDAFFHLALIVTLRGTATAVSYYRELLAEMQDRLARSISAVPKERYRLLWDNIPIWYRTRWLADTFAAHDACLVADTYTSAWCGTLDVIDENDFLESMSESYTRIYLNIGVDQMAQNVMHMIDRYHIDGLVMHSNRSCKPYSFGQYDIRRLVQAQKGIPTLMIEADIVDQRCFSEQQVKTRIEAFMELLGA